MTCSFLQKKNQIMKNSFPSVWAFLVDFRNKEYIHMNIFPIYSVSISRWEHCDPSRSWWISVQSQAVNRNSWLNQDHVTQDQLCGFKWIYRCTSWKENTYSSHVSASAGTAWEDWVKWESLCSQITKCSFWSHLLNSLPEVQAWQPRSQKAARFVMETAKLFCKAQCQDWKPELLETANNSFPVFWFIEQKAKLGKTEGGLWWMWGSASGNGAAPLPPYPLPGEAKRGTARTCGNLLTPGWLGCKGTTQPDSRTWNFLSIDSKLPNQRQSLLPALVAQK